MRTAGFLRNVPALADLPDELLERLARQTNDVRVRAGAWVMREGESADSRRHADLLIKPRAEGVGLLEFHQPDTAREAGRVAAREALEQAPPGWFA